jgi:DNA-binding NarL/FixJ family response regulator
MTRILIADGSAVVRRLLKLLIESRSGWSVCGEAVNGEEAVLKARELKPDAVILDLAMAELNGLLAAREICQALPTVPVLLHTVNNIPAVIAEAKKFGIRRVVGKGEDGDRLLDAIQEELDSKPRGVGALLDEITPQSKNPADPAPSGDRDDGPSKLN